MMLFVILLLIGAVFPVQLLLCLSGKRLPVKLIPLALPLLCLGAAGVMALTVGEAMAPRDDLLVAAILVMVSLYLLAAVATAWLICGIVKLIQKHRK